MFPAFAPRVQVHCTSNYKQPIVTPLYILCPVEQLNNKINKPRRNTPDSQLANAIGAICLHMCRMNGR